MWTDVPRIEHMSLQITDSDSNSNFEHGHQTPLRFEQATSSQPLVRL